MKIYFKSKATKPVYFTSWLCLRQSFAPGYEAPVSLSLKALFPAGQLIRKPVMVSFQTSLVSGIWMEMRMQLQRCWSKDGAVSGRPREHQNPWISSIFKGFLMFMVHKELMWNLVKFFLMLSKIDWMPGDKREYRIENIFFSLVLDK